MVGNLQHMAPPRIQHSYPYIGKIPPSRAWPTQYESAPSLVGRYPPQQIMTTEQASLECATTVLAQFSLPNLYDIRHSSLNSELWPRDTDPFHGGVGDV